MTLMCYLQEQVLWYPGHQYKYTAHTLSSQIQGYGLQNFELQITVFSDCLFTFETQSIPAETETEYPK